MNEEEYGIELNLKLDKMLEGLKTVGQKVAQVSKTVGKLSLAFAGLNALGMKKMKNLGATISKNIGKTMDKGTKSLKKFALSLFGIQAGWRTISKAVHSYLSYDSQLQKSIQQTWAGLGSFFAPILEYMVNIFKELLTYINAVVKAFTGIDFVARANAKALEKQAEASKKLAGIDELTNLSDNTNQIELADVDTTPLENIANKIKELFNAGEFAELATMFSEAVVNGLTSIKDFLSNIDIREFAQNLNEIFSGIKFEEIGTSLGQTFGEAIKLFERLFLAIDWGNLLSGLSKGIIGFINEITNTIKNIKWKEVASKLSEAITSIDWAGIGSSILEYLWESLQGIVNLFVNLDWAKVGNTVSEAVKSWIETIIKKFQETDWGELGKKIVDAIFDFIGNTDWLGLGKDILVGIYEGIKATIEFFIGIFTQIWNNICEVFKLDELIKLGSNIIEGIKSGINGIKDTVISIFSGLWESIKGVFDGVATFFVGVAETILNGLLTPINWAIDAINVVIEGANKLPFVNIGKLEHITVDFTSDKKTNSSSTSTATKSLGGSILATGFNLLTGKTTPQEVIQNGKDTAIKYIEEINKYLKKFGVQIPGLAVGTDLVKSEGLAYLHAGEQVVPADVVNGGYTGDGETNNLLRQLIDIVQEKEFSANISSDDVGRASVNYIRNQNRIMGGSIL